MATTATLETINPTSKELAALDLAAVGEYVEASLSPNTRRAYRSALADFSAWCEARELTAVPALPECVAVYVAELAGAGRSVSTITQRLAAIRWAHELAGVESPTGAKGVRATMQGIRRSLGVAPRSQKSPATSGRIAAMVAHADGSTLKGKRDRALLLLGFALAARRSELVALDLADIEQTERGLLVTIRRSKTDQSGAGLVKAVPMGSTPETCPVAALAEWIEAAGIDDGAVFRSVTRHGRIGDRLTARSVAAVVKQYAQRAGLDPAEFAGHSLRAGFVTSAAERGARLDRIADHTGHRSLAMVRVYTRRSDAFTDHAGEGLL